MENILQELGLSDLSDTFVANAITPEVVIKMTDTDFAALGLTAIGDRVRLRERCRLATTDGQDESPGMKRLKLFQEARLGNCKRNSRGPAKRKGTHRISFGWKHYMNSNFRQMVSTRGGGTISLDVPKDFNLEDLTNLLTDTYFPDGENATSGLLLADLVVNIATFTGKTITSCSGGKPFNVGDFVAEYNISPVRLYLHSKLAGVDDNDTGTPTITFNVPQLRRINFPSIEPDDVVQAGSSEAVDDSASDTDVEAQMVQAALMLSGPDLTPAGVLKWWISKTLIEEGVLPQQIVILRTRLLETTKRNIERDSFELNKPFQVVFSGEDGDDMGGPRRELLGKLMEAVAREIFTGREGNMIFQHDTAKLAKNVYQTCGKMVAWGILHGSAGLPVMNLELYKLLTNQHVDTFNIDCLDYESRIHIDQILGAQDQDEYKIILQAEFDWLTDQGCNLIIDKEAIENRDIVVQQAIKNIIYYRVHCEILQFTNGLNEVGSLHRDMLSYPSQLAPLFVIEDEELSFNTFRRLYTINFSEQGSNLRHTEEETIYCFEAYLMDCSDRSKFTDHSLSDVLEFWTGARRIPPLGFPKDLEVSFVTSDQQLLPVAHTCGLVLELQRGSTLDVFNAIMGKAISWGGEFHLA